MAQKPSAEDDDAEIGRRMTEGLMRALSTPPTPHKPGAANKAPNKKKAPNR